MQFYASHDATLLAQPPEEGMLRATIQPLARLPAWSHVTFAEVDLKQLTVRQCMPGKIGRAMCSTGPWGHMPAVTCITGLSSGHIGTQ